MPKLIYTGAGWGGSIHGVPARDLFEADLDQLRKEKDVTIKLLLESGFYKRAPKQEETTEQETVEGES